MLYRLVGTLFAKLGLELYTHSFSLSSLRTSQTPDAGAGVQETQVPHLF
jgi:hypothetical protein